MGAKLGFGLTEDTLDAHQCQVIEAIYQTTGAKVGNFIGRSGAPRYISAFNGQTVTQAQIDTLLGSTNEFLVSGLFDATSLPAASQSFVLDCAGQIADIIALETTVMFINSSQSFTTSALKSATAPTVAAPVVYVPQVFLSSLGNIAVKQTMTGAQWDTTAGLCVIYRFHVVLK